MSRVETTGVVRALELALDHARSGHYSGVTIIGYSGDGGWDTRNAGSIMRTPSTGVAAAFILASQFAKKMETEVLVASHADRRA
jgi:hypothetical protein